LKSTNCTYLLSNAHTSIAYSRIGIHLRNNTRRALNNYRYHRHILRTDTATEQIPCLTRELTWKTNGRLLFHFTQAKQPASQFSESPNNSTGTCRFISFIYNALWLTLSKVFVQSIEQTLTVLSPSTHRSIIFPTFFRTV